MGVESRLKQRTVGGVVIAIILIILLSLFWHAMRKQPSMAPIEVEFPPPPQQPYISGEQQPTQATRQDKPAQSKDAMTPYQVVSRESMQQAATLPADKATPSQQGSFVTAGDDGMTVATGIIDNKVGKPTEAETSNVNSVADAAIVTTPLKRDAVESNIKATSSTAVNRKTTQNLKAWSIQVASFSDQAHAIKLRDQLRRQGFHAYINHTYTTQGARIRVFVGPELNRYKAQLLLAKVNKQLHAKGFIVRYEASQL